MNDDNYGTDEFWKEQERLAEEERIMDRLLREERTNMSKADICIGDTLYWNTTGAYESKISLKCEVVDIGKMFIWVLVNGCLGYNNLAASNLSKEPLYKVTNK